MYQSDVSRRCIEPIHQEDIDPSRITQGGHIRARLEPGCRRTLSVMGTRRSVVEYGLARRATIASVYAGHTTVSDVCEAHPYLLRAAKFHGEPTEAPCPICRKTKLTHVTYVYGDELGQYEGRVKRGPELDEMAAEYGEFRGYVGEVCQNCGWDPLATSLRPGHGRATSPARPARTNGSVNVIDPSAGERGGLAPERASVSRSQRSARGPQQ